jgi:hypothetical protein
VPLPAVPAPLLAAGFRRALLKFLAENDAISGELRSRMLGWRYSGFSAHNQMRLGEEDAEGRKKLAGYMLRAPMSLEKMSYDAETGTVIYRSRMHLGLKRDFQVLLIVSLELGNRFRRYQAGELRAHREPSDLRRRTSNGFHIIAQNER